MYCTIAVKLLKSQESWDTALSVNVSGLAESATHNNRKSSRQPPTTLNRTVAIMADNTPTSSNDLLQGGQAQAQTPEEVAKENNLLPKLITHLDRHLIFPLLQFAEQDDDQPEITKAKYELLKKTNMTDYVASLYCEINNLEEAPKEFGQKRQEVLDRLELYGEESEKIVELLQNEDVITNLRSDKVANLEYLKKEHSVCIRSELRGLFTDSVRLRLQWLTFYMILATSNIAVVTTKPQQTSYINSAFSLRIMTRSQPQLGES